MGFSLFARLLTDIHGNKQIMNMLPAMRKVGADLYNNRLFPTEHDGKPVDYTNIPMHLQFLYKIIRQEMIPGSETPVRQEVDEAIDQLRNFQGGQIDLISFLTDPGARGANGKKLSGSDRFDYWLTQIWPKYEKLMKLDKQEAKDAQTQQQNGDQQTNNTADLAPQAGLLLPDGRIRDINKALMADAIGTTVGAVFGSSTVTWAMQIRGRSAVFLGQS